MFLWGMFQHALGEGENGAKNLQKGNFVSSGKQVSEEACQNLLKSRISFGGGLEDCNKKMERQQNEEVL